MIPRRETGLATGPAEVLDRYFYGYFWISRSRREQKIRFIYRAHNIIRAVNVFLMNYNVTGTVNFFERTKRCPEEYILKIDL